MRRLFLALGILLISLSLKAQDVTVNVDAPSSAVAGQGFRIIFTVNSTDGKFVPPQFDPSFSVSGPQTSSSHNVQWINGEVTRISSTILVYYVVPSQKGSFTIPPAQYTVKQNTYSSQPVQIEVTGEAAQTDNANPTNQEAGSTQRQPAGEVSLKLLLNENEVYIGQPITATLKIYTRVNLSGLNDLKYPEMKGFLREDIETPPLRELQMETIGGVQYGTGVIQKFMLYPQAAGDIKIEPVKITALVQQKSSSGDSFWDDTFANDPFFKNVFNNVTNVPRELNTGYKTITVKPLPSPQPSDFHGAVGSFELSSSIDKTDLEVNDAITYRLVLKGAGNLSLAGAPVISFPQGIEKYDPKINVKTTGPGTGSKIFEFLLIPRNKGTFEIPPVSYTVFDPGQKKYITLREKGYTINVTGSSNASDNVQTAVTSPGEDVKYLGQDIRFIRSNDTKLFASKPALINSLNYWMWFILAIVVAGAGLLVRKEYIRRNSDIAGVRTRKAAGVARKRLTKAHTYMNSNKPELVHEELARALWGYMGDKLSIPLAELTRENCYSLLRQKSVNEELIIEFDRILAACEYSRFSRAAESESPENLYHRTADLISKLENVL